jgi:hypothetical protein
MERNVVSKKDPGKNSIIKYCLAEGGVYRLHAYAHYYSAVPAVVDEAETFLISMASDIP